MAKMNPTEKKAFLARMAKGRRSAGAAAGRVAGAMVKRRKPTPKRRAGAAGMARVPAILPKRKDHPRGRVGGGTPAVRMARIETAVTDLARANHAIVSKVVEHERRLNSVESTLSNWAKGRK